MSQAYEHKKLVDQSQVLSACDEIEAEIAALRASYEQYFLGIDRKPPSEAHKNLKKRLQQMRGMFVRQTAAKFRIQSVQQKFTTYERLWSRTIQEIENGTYVRDLRRVQRKGQQKATAQKAPERDDIAIDEVSPEEADALLNGSAFEAPAPKAAPPAAATGGAVAPLTPGIAPVVPPGARAAATPAKSPATPLISAPLAPGGAAPARAAAPSSAPTARPQAASPQRGVTVPPATAAGSSPPQARPPNAALGDDKLRAVYDAYVKAKKRCNEDVGSMSYDQVATNLRKQVPELMKKHNAKGVEFKVVIKDGKAVLRAVPKE